MASAEAKAMVAASAPRRAASRKRRRDCPSAWGAPQRMGSVVLQTDRGEGQSQALKRHAMRRAARGCVTVGGFHARTKARIDQPTSSHSAKLAP
eukprot:357586-Chlamydomonas_euryale.AAC.6